MILCSFVNSISTGSEDKCNNVIYNIQDDTHPCTMFVYMSKKIAIPKQSSVNCISWNRSSGYIAVGGDDGMLKVLKLESGGGGNLSMNLSLEGHSGQLQVATWNEIHQKLTTSDQHGVIIVWMLYKGSWYEEMINNRNKSTVRGMAWGSDGQKICIAYEDGAVIVGSVDGSRVWGKDIKGPGLSAVQWSPDNSLLLFALSNGELHLYDNQGNFAMQVSVQCSADSSDVVGLDWYSGKAPPERPVLAICYRDGSIQLMKNYSDEDVIIVESAMQAIDCHWNHNGTTLAVAGIMKDGSNTVQFFNAYGEHHRTLRVPAGSMKAISWEGRSLRLAIAVDSFIYFANVKPDHKRALYGNTLAFCSGTDTVTFWDMSTHQTWVNHLPGVVDMSGAEEYCVVATANTLVISNQQGIQCDAKSLSIAICHVAINAKGIVVAASKDSFIVWKFATPTRLATSEQMFRADGTPHTGTSAASEDYVSCICCSDTHLLIGRESGSIVLFSMLNFKKIAAFNMPSRPYKMGLNSNSSKFFVIDISGSIYLFDTDMANNLSIGQALKKDVWCGLWAADNPQLLAVAEKARLYIFRGTEPEEPLPVQGYICKFKDLETTSVLLDDMGDKCSEQQVVKVEVKSLRDTRQLLHKVGLKEAETFIQDNPHPQLWLLLAEAALKKFEVEGALDTAEAAFVRRSDYAGVRFIRRLSALHSPALRKAEILTYFKDFDAAEKIYLDEDRRDMAIALRRRVGHWFRVVELLKLSANTTDAQIMEAYSSIGDYYIDRQNWSSAVEYYNMANNIEGLTKCYVALEDTESLANFTAGTPKKSKDASLKPLDTYDYSQQPPSVAIIVQLTESGRMLQAAAMAFQLASAEAAKKESPLKLKKLFVLAGHLYSQNSVDGAKNRDAVRCYKLATAQHWLGTATARALAKPMRTEAAMRAAARLESVIHDLHENQQLEAWCTIALVAAEARAFATCSRAFINLEVLETDDTFKNLAIDIFIRHSPKDPKGNRIDCPKCQLGLSDWMASCPGCSMEFPGCSVTGRPLYSASTVWTCRACSQPAAHHDLVLRHSCPVCHSSLS